ncbi:hypothetical protein P2E05_15515 [Providencia stuartii]|uniref:phage tail fiber protein n=1 Tax=Providencia stuartii TaxID=588 RepID=UPI0023E1CC26|nr:hypothetical protein [Providencia stuartii]WER21471.1 hypothetical protein P2E04_15510 [Providencia stuartii]WER25591.1 hypothetical protein P2E05_15515 [Providencia stuartii]WER29681.1 hypothetical protein P2E06_15515 [Providencia stuartii]
MYNAGTVTTTANSTKLVGVGTKWEDNNSRVSAEQVILIQNGATIYINSIASIQSNTEITLSFPVPASVSNAPYQILTTMVNSVSDAANKIVAMNVSNVQFSDILNRWATESGTITVTLPDGTTQQLRTAKEMDKQLDGKFDKTGGALSGRLSVKESLEIKDSPWPGVTLTLPDNDSVRIEAGRGNDMVYFIYRDKDGKSQNQAVLKRKNGIVLTDLDYYKPTGFEGYGGFAHYGRMEARSDRSGANVNIAEDFPIGVSAGICSLKDYGAGSSEYTLGTLLTVRGWNDPTGASAQGQLLITDVSIFGRTAYKNADNKSQFYSPWKAYTDKNTTKDSNGNLKAASPVVKLFADHIELNEESEGVEMEHLGVGHYLIKGVVGFNSDGAWGINNGFVIPQDHNGKNMVLIDYEVRPDGDIEVFVFHQQNADLPERFQNKRIKHLDEDGNPVYYENYEPCDVPESRWIDMRVEMPVNSIYNLKQAEAERLAKEEAERQAEEAKNAEIEAEEDI